MFALSALPQTDRAGRVHRPLVAVAVAVVPLVATAILAVLLLNSRTATYAPDSPEGIHQRFLAAFRTGDHETASALFSTRVQSEMSLSAYVDECTSRSDSKANVRVWIDRTERDGTRATLHLTLERTCAAGLRSSRYRHTDEVRLVLEGGSWRVDQRLIGTEPSYRWPSAGRGRRGHAHSTASVPLRRLGGGHRPARGRPGDAGATAVRPGRVRPPRRPRCSPPRPTACARTLAWRSR
jgi:hypothetical protein